jgi:flagellar basal body-associated protein FliL
VIRTIFLGIWIAVVTIGAAAGVRLLSVPSDATPSEKPSIVEVRTMEPITVPSIRDGTVAGYVVLRMHFSADAKFLKKSEKLLTVYVAEAAFTAIFEDTRLDFSDFKPIALDPLRSQIMKRINERLGATVVHDVIFDSLNFIRAHEVRAN